MGIAGAFTTGIVGLIIGLKLQKSAARAGRLGVMKSLEDLSDNRYYANVEQ